MPVSTIQANQANYLSSNIALQATGFTIQASQSTFLESNNALQATGFTIQANQSTFLESVNALQATPFYYPWTFTIPATQKQDWVD